MNLYSRIISLNIVKQMVTSNAREERIEKRTEVLIYSKYLRVIYTAVSSETKKVFV